MTTKGKGNEGTGFVDSQRGEEMGRPQRPADNGVSLAPEVYDLITENGAYPSRWAAWQRRFWFGKVRS